MFCSSGKWLQASLGQHSIRLQIWWKTTVTYGRFHVHVLLFFTVKAVWYTFLNEWLMFKMYALIMSLNKYDSKLQASPSCVLPWITCNVYSYELFTALILRWLWNIFVETERERNMWTVWFWIVSSHCWPLCKCDSCGMKKINKLKCINLCHSEYL